MTSIIADTPLRPWRFGVLAGGASAALWAYVALAMPTSNRPAHVGLFLFVFAGLFALYLVAIAAIRRRRWRPSLPVIFGFALVFRLLAVGAGLPPGATVTHLAADLTSQRVAYEPFLLYDNDLWRYLWDGHATAEGLNPYLVPPSRALEDGAIERRLLATERWRDVHDAVSFRNYGTIYPPLIHFFFAGLAKIAPASAAAAKLSLATLDLLLCLLLWRVLAAAGGRRSLVLVYAWNPAVIKEFSGSGHPDVLMMLALVAGVYLLGRGRGWAGGAALAASVLAKLASAVTLPLLALWSLRRHGPAVTGQATLAAAAVLAVSLWPLAAGLGAWLDALGVFAERWTFNSGVWASVRWIFAVLGAGDPDGLAHGLTRAAIAGGAIAIAARRGWRLPASGEDPGARIEALFHGLFLTLALLVLLSPAVMPWYVLWALPAAVVADNRWWPVFTGLAFLSYLTYADGIGTALWWKWLEYGALAVIVWWDTRSIRANAGGGAVS